MAEVDTTTAFMALLPVTSVADWNRLNAGLAHDRPTRPVRRNVTMTNTIYVHIYAIK